MRSLQTKTRRQTPLSATREGLHATRPRAAENEFKTNSSSRVDTWNNPNEWRKMLTLIIYLIDFEFFYVHIAFIMNIGISTSTFIYIYIYTGSSKKQENSRKSSISALLTMPKPLTVWITINCGKFWKRWEYQTTWTASWENHMHVRKQQLELDMEQQTGSK